MKAPQPEKVYSQRKVLCESKIKLVISVPKPPVAIPVSTQDAVLTVAKLGPDCYVTNSVVEKNDHQELSPDSGNVKQSQGPELQDPQSGLQIKASNPDQESISRVGESQSEQFPLRPQGSIFENDCQDLVQPRVHAELMNSGEKPLPAVKVKEPSGSYAPVQTMRTDSNWTTVMSSSSGGESLIKRNPGMMPGG